MDSTECLKQLSDQFGHEDWFHSTGLDQYGRLVVYVKHMNHATLNDIPSRVDGKQVLVHFAGSLPTATNQYVSRPQAPGASLTPYQPINLVFAEGDRPTGILPLAIEQSEEDDVAGSEEEEKSILYLQRELDKLEKACGSYTLQDIFYEIQDGKNAVTNMSARYPDVRKSLERLYNLYGFDVIYEELDG